MISPFVLVSIFSGLAIALLWSKVAGASEEPIDSDVHPGPLMIESVASVQVQVGMVWDSRSTG